MNKRLKSIKLWYLFTAVSAVVILAGIILYVLLGFNNVAEKPKYKTFEVQYSVDAVIKEKDEDIQKACESAFKEEKISYTTKEVYDEIAGASGAETGSKRLVYEFSPSVSDTALAAAKAKADTNLVFGGIDERMITTVNTVVMQTFNEASWRAAVGIAVGAVVALIYIGVRFGLGAALSGSVGVVNGVFFTLGFLAITRIPVYAISPLLYASIAALLTVFLWMLHCIKMRENFKDPDFKKNSSGEGLAASLLSSDKLVYVTAGAALVAVAVIGLVASAGVRTLVLPALVAVAASLYSASLFAPAVHLPVKEKFDAVREAKIAKYGYKKKPKAEKKESKEEE